MVTAAVASGFPVPQREAREPSELGRRIADRYQIERLGPEDVSTVTVIARHLALEERVQVQVLRPEQRFDSQRSAQYLHAIKALARIKTDHVVRVLDVGVALYLGPFLVLEELEGKTLAELLRSDGPLPVPRAVDYVLQACKGLAVAHAAGIVHGQLHPARLLLARRGEFETLKVVGFPTLEVSTAERQPAYLAPEVLSQRSADRRADVWSLGAVLYELVTGRAAFAPTAPTVPAAAGVTADNDARAYDDPAVAAALTPALRGIIARCLQPDPEQRFADVEALAAELMPLTTMSEVFRGSLTGSFSRQMMMAAAAQARAAASAERTAGAAARRPQSSGWRARLRGVPASPSLQRWSERWQALARHWEARKPPGAPALPVALGGAALLLCVVGSAALSDFTLRPPPPAEALSAPSVVVAALSPQQPAAAGEAAPVAEPPLAEPAAVAPVPVAAEPSGAQPLEVLSEVAGQPGAGLLAGSLPPVLGRPPALAEPPGAEPRRSSKAAAKRRATRERALSKGASAASKDAASKDAASKDAASKDAASKDAVSKRAVSKRRERRARAAAPAE